MASLAGKVYAVTGAASGIGLATARILAARGASLCLADLDQTRLDTAIASLPGNDRTRFTAIPTDVRHRDSVRAFMTHTLKQFGKVDGCANVAGVSGKEVSVRPVWEASSEDYDFVNAVNARGVFNCLSEQLRPGVVSEGGSVVNVSSIAGIRAMPKSAAYVASKHAVVGLTRVAAADAGPRNIRVNSVNPGTIDTPMLRAGYEAAPHSTPPVPLGREGKPEELGNVIAFLLSDESSYVTGAVYSADGGWCA